MRGESVESSEDAPDRSLSAASNSNPGQSNTRAAGETKSVVALCARLGEPSWKR